MIDDLLDPFGGSARPLMAHLAEAGKLSLEDVRELETLLSEKSAEKNVAPGRRGNRESTNRGGDQ